MLIDYFIFVPVNKIETHVEHIIIRYVSIRFFALAHVSLMYVNATIIKMQESRRNPLSLLHTWVLNLSDILQFRGFYDEDTLFVAHLTVDQTHLDLIKRGLSIQAFTILAQFPKKYTILCIQ